VELDLGAVRAFVAVAEERFFGEAAVRLGMSQQAVSKRVAKLESDLGVPLLHRSRGGAEPTDDGRSFLPQARALLSLADQSVELMRSRHRAFRVDVLTTKVASIDLIRIFHEVAPDVEIDIVSSNGLRTTEPALLRGRVDAAFGRAASVTDEQIENIPAYLEPLYVLVGRRHPLARLTRVPMAEMRGLTAWMPGVEEPDTEWADYYRHCTARFGVGIDPLGPKFGPDHFVERIGGSDEVFSLVGERTRIASHPDVLQLPLVDPTPVWPWSLLWHPRNRHPALPLLIASVKEGYRPIDPAEQWLPEMDRPYFT
jgi:DNA-binding transcriptional LysR family regulator